MLLKCTGKWLEGSGAENVWLEAGVYGPTVIQNSILDGGHYSRPLDGQKLLAKSMQCLLSKEFFSMKGVTNYSLKLQILCQLKKSTANGNVLESQKILKDSQVSSSTPTDDLSTFINTRSSARWEHQILVSVSETTWNNCWFVASWPWRIMAVAPWCNVTCRLWVCCLGLHKLSVMGNNILRRCKESARNSTICVQKCHGRTIFSSKNKPGRFSAVGGDQNLEQTINLSSKCSDSVIGHTKQKQYMAEWDLNYHEIMAVKNLHCEYASVNESTSSALLHH